MRRRILPTILLLLSLAPGMALAETPVAERAAGRGVVESLFSWLPGLWDQFVVLFDDNGGSLDPWGGAKAIVPPGPEEG